VYKFSIFLCQNSNVSTNSCSKTTPAAADATGMSPPRHCIWWINSPDKKSGHGSHKFRAQTQLRHPLLVIPRLLAGRSPPTRREACRGARRRASSAAWARSPPEVSCPVNPCCLFEAFLLAPGWGLTILGVLGAALPTVCGEGAISRVRWGDDSD
jgi:hypothetical protein